MSDNAEFQGIYTALITPMTPSHELNEEVFREVVEFNIQSGINGFWVAGGSGESVLLGDDENSRMAKIVTEQTDGRAKIIMHVGAPTTKRAAKMAENAAKAGVDAICCIPPFFYDQSDKAIAQHYGVVAGAASLPFFAYNLPSSTGCEITPAMMALFQETVPEIKGLKHSAYNFTYVREFVNMGLSCFIGFSALTLPALSLGAVGTVDGAPGIAPEYWVELWKAFQNGDMEQARAAQDKGIAVCNLLRIGSFHGVLKSAVSYRLGLDCGTPRPPGIPLSKAEDEILRKRLLDLNLLSTGA